MALLECILLRLLIFAVRDKRSGSALTHAAFLRRTGRADVPRYRAGFFVIGTMSTRKFLMNLLIIFRIQFDFSICRLATADASTKF